MLIRGTMERPEQVRQHLPGLTPLQLDVTEERRLMPSMPPTGQTRIDQRHDARSPRWMGDKRQYQREAQVTYAWSMNRSLMPWSWVTTSCELDNCLDPECMTIHAPTHIDYPAGICTYCGDPSGSRDHLLPKPHSGETARRLVAVVPACVNCNSRINDSFAVSVSDRREIAHRSIARRYKALLAVADKTPEQLAEFGPALRSVSIKNTNKRAWIRGRLAWPLDPHYDLRAFQRSGIDDPAGLGLI